MNGFQFGQDIRLYCGGFLCFVTAAVDDPAALTAPTCGSTATATLLLGAEQLVPDDDASVVAAR
jgi:hypothetical protein